MSNQLEQLKEMTEVVADTGNIEAIKQHQPQDATTNPSLILQASKLPDYQTLIKNTVSSAKGNANEEKVSDACDRIAVSIGCEILDIIPGVISTEVDANLSFDTDATYRKAKKIAELYKAAGISTDRILIKIASTWEGIQAARMLQNEGLNCNLTLLFNFAQAAACADANATLISPFVGRILDWYKSNNPEQNYDAEKDPGVQSVSNIYNYYKQHNISTIVMGASFRSRQQIEQLAGCDKLTISPSLLTELSNSNLPLSRKLTPSSIEMSPTSTETQWRPTEAEFRWHLNEDAMATEKLAEGIRKFAADQQRLSEMVREYGI